MKQEKQHLQSTSKTSLDDDFLPLKEEKTRDIIYTITEYSDKEIAASDLTGRFPYRCSRGHQYVMVMYNMILMLSWIRL